MRIGKCKNTAKIYRGSLPESIVGLLVEEQVYFVIKQPSIQFTVHVVSMQQACTTGRGHENNLADHQPAQSNNYKTRSVANSTIGLIVYIHI